MTFLEEIKEELEGLRIKKSCCMESEIRGMLMLGGADFMGNALFGTESLTLAKRFASNLRKVCNISYDERLSEDAESYKFLIPDDILAQLGLGASGGIFELEDKEESECCKHAFVRGAFLASGSASNPEKAYRMEIFSENEAAADKVHGILSDFGVDAKRTVRKNLFVVYANKGESVSDMLKVTEASMAVFSVLEAMVLKNKRNEINRVTNCDIANADRASKNSSRESHAIRVIEKHMGLENLKPQLREAAQLRLDNPGASIAELATLCDPPLPKSTLNNRLNRLIAIAKEFGE